MPEFYYKYGVMNSSKTANLLMVVHNYESLGRHILCLKPSLDTRWQENSDSKIGKIESRAIPNPHSCELVSSSENLFQLVKQENSETIMKYSSKLFAVFVDEAQFLTTEQVKQLADVVDKLSIDVFCYGLKNTYKDGELFDGSAALTYYATDIEEVWTICKYCEKKATMNLRIVDGKAIYNGESIAIGDVTDGVETYAQVCYHHYCYPPAPIEGMYVKKNNVLTYKDYADRFNYILKYRNDQGYYCTLKEPLKEDLEFSIVFIPSNERYEELKYISFGKLFVDVEEYAKSSKGKSVNSKVVTDIIISFIYTFYENDFKTAFNILKSSQVAGVEFFEDEKAYNTYAETHKNSTLTRIYNLPDGHKYYYEYKSNRKTWVFWENLMAGIRSKININNVGFYTKKEKNEDA